MITIRQITIKSTSRCNAACYHCRDRRSLYSEKRVDSPDLSYNLAEMLLVKHSSNALKKITYSGGEPTLAQNLKNLISLASRYVSQIAVNTNGWKTDLDYWRSLADSGLSNVNISIDSSDRELHDWLRNKRGLFDKAVKLAESLSHQAKSIGIKEVCVITIVSTFSILKLDSFLKLMIDLGVNSLIIHYPECDEEVLFSPNKFKQNYFRQVVLPKSTSLMENLPPSVCSVAIKCLSNIYKPTILPLRLSSKGIYHKIPFSCPVPKKFLLMKYDGTLLACNGGEYSDEAIIGAIKKSDSNSYFDRGLQKKIANRGIYYCKYCPVPLTIKVPLR